MRIVLTEEFKICTTTEFVGEMEYWLQILNLRYNLKYIKPDRIEITMFPQVKTWFEQETNFLFKNILCNLSYRIKTTSIEEQLTLYIEKE